MEDLKRREFIKNTLIAGVGTSLAVPILRSRDSRQKINPETVNKLLVKPPTARKVIVAGAGISGLCCAYELMKSGHEVVVLEASGRHGGHVFTGRDGLSDGLYADYGADHITKPGYEFFFEYARELDLTVLPYRQGKDGLRMIGGKFYSEEMLADPAILKQFGFNEREVKCLSANPWWALQSLYLDPYIKKISDAYQPFGIGYDDLDNISIADLYKKEGASQAALDFFGGKNTSALYK